VHDAVRETGANASVIFVPPPFAADAIMEAADAGMPLVVCITEGIPTVDMLKVIMTFLEGKPDAAGRAQLSGRHHAGQAKAGIIPGHICREGAVGIVSKSGTLTYEAIHQLTRSASGRRPASASAAIRSSARVHRRAALFAADPDTEAVIMIGEIGGTAEEGGRRVHRARVQEAGRRVHRRPDGAARPPDGACRRHHRRRQGHGGREDGGARPRRASRREEPGRHGRK
jgi:succinyl-CoA synthetase alpha subunit